MNVKAVDIWILIMINVIPIVSQSLQAQMPEKCEVLNFMLKNKEIQRAFFSDKEEDRTVVVADKTQNDWEQCNGYLFNSRKILLEKIDSSLVDQKIVYHIVLYEFKKYGKIYKAHLHQAETNAYAKVEIRKRRRSMKIISIDISHF